MKLGVLAGLVALISLSAHADGTYCEAQAVKRAKELFLFHFDPEAKDSPVFSYSKPVIIKGPYKRRGNVLVQLEVVAQVDAKANYSITLTYIRNACGLVGEEIYEEWARK